MKKILIMFVFIAGPFLCNAQWGLLFSRHINFETNSQYAVINPGFPYTIWQVGTPRKTFFNAANSVPYAIVTDTINFYPPGNTSSFDVKIISPQSCWGTAYLYFTHKYDTDSTQAGGYLEVAYRDSTNFRNIIFDTVNVLPFGWMPPQNFYTKTDTITGGIPCFHGHSNGWVTSSFAWIWQMGVKSIDPDSIDSLTIRFVFKSNSSAVPKEGWMVDDIDLSLYNCTGSIQDLENHLPMISVVPNPVTSQSKVMMFNFRHDQYIFTLYNFEGTKVLEKFGVDPSAYTLEKGELTSGLYFLNVRGKSGESAWTKVVVE